MSKLRSIFIGRNSELQWLDKNSRLSAALILTGVRGIGKTWLIKHWVESKKLKVKWFSVERFKTFAEMIGQKGDFETALEKASEQWSGLDAIIWDDLEQSLPQVRNTLLSFIKASPQLPLQILISDEELPREFLAEFSFLKLSPFDTKEIELFLKTFSDDEDNQNTTQVVDEVDQQTGGIPLLLKLWVQSEHRKNRLISSIVETLTEQEKKIFKLGVVLKRPLETKELKQYLNQNNLDIDQLVRKNLFEQMSLDEDHYRVPLYISNLYIKELNEKKIQEIKKEASLFLKSQEKNDPFEEFLLGIETSNLQMVLTQVLNVGIDRLETLSSKELEDFIQKATLLEDQFSRAVPEYARFIRMIVRTFFLLGKRKEAKTKAQGYAQFVEKNALFNSEIENFILEYVQLLNRTSDFAEAKRVSQSYLSKVQEPAYSLISIELAVSYMSNQLDHAESILKKVIQSTREPFKSSEERLVFAQANFQIGRVFDFKSEWEKAEEHFQLAHKIYKNDLNQTYFASVALMNVCWMVFQSKNWTRLRSVLHEGYSDAKRFGYNYVLAGLAVIEASFLRQHYHLSESFQKIESVMSYLGNSPPLIPYVDAQAEKIKTLWMMGLRDQARSDYFDLEKSVKMRMDPIIERKLNSIKIEMDAIDLNTESWFEKWESKSPDPDLWARLTIDQNQNPSAKEQGTFGQLAYLEKELTELIHQQEEAELLWVKIAEIENLLSTFSDPCSEKIAILLLQAQISQDIAKKDELYKKAQMELLRWSADIEVKAGLVEWLNYLKNNLSEKPEFKKIRPGDKRRWLRWIRSSQNINQKKYRILVNGKIEETDTLPTPAQNKDGFLIYEEFGEIYSRGRKIKDLLNRHMLRKLFIVLIEQCPEAVAKPTIVGAIWGESYRPDYHDSRIYTAIQRLRTLLRVKDSIQNIENAYRFNPSLYYVLVRSNYAALKNPHLTGNPRIHALIIKSLESFSISGKKWVARSDLLEVTGTSEATLKRELSKLFTEGAILRRGAGRSVEYSLKSK